MSLILVSGVNGFIGSHIAEKLLAGGHRVRGIVRRTSGLGFIKDMDIEVLVGDVADPGSIAGPMKGVEIVVHAAGLASDWGPYGKFHDVNVTGTKNMAQAAQQSGVRRFVHISSAAICGFEGFRDADESRPPARTPFPYCETKKMAEEWLFDFAESTGMEVCALRPGNVFGPRDHTFIEKYADAMRDGKIGYIDGGKKLTCPTYVENLSHAVLKACFEPGAAGERFFITDGLEVDWRTFTEKFADELGLPRPRLSIPFWLAYGSASLMESLYRLLGVARPPLLTRYRIMNGGRDYHFSVEKARRVLGYRPEIPFEEAIKRTAAWWLEKKRAQRDSNPRPADS